MESLRQFHLFTIQRMLRHQVALNELVNLTVHNRLNVRAFDTRAQILHQLIGMKHIRTNLVTPGDVTLAGFDFA